MGLPKHLSDKLIKDLNDACNVFSKACNGHCHDLGWCEACWIVASAKRKVEDGKDKQRERETR
jgi:hypothetical protein